MNQKDPISNITPNRDTFEFPEKRAESKKDKTIPAPDRSKKDFGKIILPSKNLAIAQKIIQTARPITNNNPFAVSIGILVKGKQKIGNNTITESKDKKEILSNILERIG